MKYKDFKQRIKHIVEIYKVLSEKEIALEKAFGEGTSIQSVEVAQIVDKMTNQLAKEMNDKNELIDTLIFENLLYVDYNKKNNILVVEGKKYPATIKQVWKLLND